jgi:predicted DNA-binding transcriptional regulator YafY
LAFTFDEALALYLGRRLLDPLAGTFFWQAAHRAFRKIRATLGTNAIDYIERLAPSIHQTTFGSSDYSSKAVEIDELMVAIEDRRPLIITYQPERSTEPVEYEIYPYGFVYHKGSIYAIAWSRDSNAVRHFKIDRLVKIAVSSELHFELPEHFNLQEHLSGSFGIYQGTGSIRVKIRFSPKVARYVSESTWHKSQTLTSRRDGSLDVTFDLSTTSELRQWVLSFGAEAEVLEPEKLRQEIAETAEAIVCLYRRHVPLTAKVCRKHTPAPSPRVRDRGPR